MKSWKPLLALLAIPCAVQAATNFVDLGTSAPPGSVGALTVTAFDTTPQAAIPDFTNVTVIPGSPIAGDLGTAPALSKRTVPGGGWASWSHGYTGPVFATSAPTTVPDAETNSGEAGDGVSTQAVLTLPPGATAFYLYVEPNTFGLFDVQVTTDTGGDSGAIAVEGDGGAHGFAFWVDTMGETISTVTVTVQDNGFAIGEFGTTDEVPVSVELQTFAIE
ncbi:MAG: hypothetical protein R2991_11730 [Thermoanaerobaculia bacterium]